MSKPKGYFWVLGASLGINLLLIGALGGDWLKGRLYSHGTPIHWATSDLDEASRIKVKSMLDQDISVTQSMRSDFRKSQQQLRTIVGRPELDKTALSNNLKEMRKMTSVYQNLLHDSMLRVLPELTAEQRVAVTRRLLRPNHGQKPFDARHGKPSNTHDRQDKGKPPH